MFPRRRPRQEFDDVCHRLVEALSAVGVVHVVGSYGRGDETCGDLDLLVVGEMERIVYVLSSLRARRPVTGDRKTTSVIDGCLVDVWCCSQLHLGAAMLYTRGPTRNNIMMRSRALALGMRLDFFGLWKCDELVAAESADDILMKLGMGDKR